MLQDTLISSAVFIYGTAVGSFLNVLSLRYVDQLQADRTLPATLLGRSVCPACAQTLRWWELLPVLSFIMLRGRCRRCRAAISYQYPLIELSGGICLVLLLRQGQPLVEVLLLFSIVCLLLVLAVVDFRTLLLPDSFLGLLSLAVALYRLLRDHQFTPSLLGGVLAGTGFLFLLWLVTRRQGIGFGDVKLMLPLGALFSFPNVIVILLVAFSLGGVVGLLLLWRTRATLKTAVPFGPFLISAALLQLLWPTLAPHFFSLVWPRGIL